MKISRQRLRQIVKEEKARLNELFGMGGPSDEELIAASSQDAFDLYDAMKGMGTDEDAIRDILTKRSEDLSTLTSEYDQLIAAAEEEEDLATWLEDDGMDEEAELVRGGGAADAAAAWAAADSGTGTTDPATAEVFGGDGAGAVAESADLLRQFIRESISTALVKDRLIRESNPQANRDALLYARDREMMSQLEDLEQQQIAIVQDQASSPTVHKQLVQLVSAYLRTGKLGRGSMEWRDQVYDLNPKAIAEADQILTRALHEREPLQNLTSDTNVDAAINEFMQLTMMGAAEVASDRMAARDTPPAAPVWSGIKTSSFD
jgi:hypothetical protein